MKRTITGRREFLKAVAATAAAPWMQETTSVQGRPSQGQLLKACQWRMLPKQLSDAKRISLAKRCGFEGIEMSGAMEDLDRAKALGAKARQAGVPIHSVSFGGWHAPLSDPRAEVVAKGLAGMETAMRSAKAMGADVVLLVPAVVTETVSYRQAYERSQKNIRKLLPLAEELGVTIAVENVWNKFLLSPLEFARYIDEFDHPRLKAYFDIGNVILFGFSQDWIRTLGRRIVRIHLKDFKRKGYQWTNLLDGDVNWPEVRKALHEIGYTGYLTTELSAGKESYLTDLARRIDKIIAMDKT